MGVTAGRGVTVGRGVAVARGVALATGWGVGVGPGVGATVGVPAAVSDGFGDAEVVGDPLDAFDGAARVGDASTDAPAVASTDGDVAGAPHPTTPTARTRQRLVNRRDIG